MGENWSKQCLRAPAWGYLQGGPVFTDLALALEAQFDSSFELLACHPWLAVRVERWLTFSKLKGFSGLSAHVLSSACRSLVLPRPRLLRRVRVLKNHLAHQL